MDAALAKLNPEQHAAVTSPSGCTVIVAGPGACGRDGGVTARKYFCVCLFLFPFLLTASIKQHTDVPRPSSEFGLQ